MSHFTVAVFTKDGGKTIEELLAPYNENVEKGDIYAKFIDVEDENRKEFENSTRQEFYCNSNSSWGQEVTKDTYEILKNHNVGDKIDLHITKSLGWSYFKNNCEYKCYYNEKHEYPKEHIWIKVINIIDTTHPDKDVCFEGIITVELINEPKEIPLKEYYNNFEEYMEDFCGYCRDEEIGKYGYWENPNAEWDWYSIGGRWSGELKLKPTATSGEYGEKSWTNENQVIPENMVDSAKIKDIDFSNDFTTYAVITPDGEWHSKGEMGWWGCSSETPEESDKWNKSFKETFIDNANPEWTLTVVDCHI